MKNLKLILLVAITIIAGSPLFAQKDNIVLNTNKVPEVVHVNLADFPKDQVLPMIHGWGGLTVDVNNLPKGTDFKPLLKGLENDHCQVPHWGYVVKGAILIEYEDGSENIFSEGELEENSVCRNFRHTANDGKTYDKQYYNLDVIISVGYRVTRQK